MTKNWKISFVID